MADNLLEITDANFETEVLKAAEPVLIDFGAPWCMPCQMLAPTIEAIADQYAGKVRVGAVNTDKNPKISSKYQVTALPTVALFKGGEVVERFMGPRPQKVIASMLDKHIG